MNRHHRALGLLIAATTIAAALRAAEPVPTVISSDRGEMVSTETEATFRFESNVEVTGTNMKITCDELVVVAYRTGDPKATIGEQNKFKSLIATGNVQIVQNDRVATCQRAEVLPGDDKAILSGNVVVRSLDEQGESRIEAPLVELHRGERRVVIPQRNRIILPTLKDLGYEPELGKSSPAAPQTTPSGTQQKK